MNQTIRMHAHQNDAVWRAMSSGNTLVAQAVGAGKTFTMAATGMKMKQAGLIKKPLLVVPNHLLEQFGREFLHLYPNARLLIAGKEDLARDRRKLLTAEIASGEWDGIVVTHSSFERIGMSRGYQEKFLNEQIEEYNQLLLDSGSKGAARAHRNIIKTIERQKAAREARLKDLLAVDKKDDGLVFDELGVDHVFIDEAHYFKNLETPTKMDRVAGIQSGGSERAFDLYMKCRYLHGLHPGRGVTFATGTPISNTLVELYTMQRFLDPEGLTSRGIEHFDAWAATFGEVVEAMEISPDGKTLKPRARFSKFVNLPELQQMFRAFADVQTAEMLNLPRPALEGGKAQVVACPMSDEQQELQLKLVERYERIRNGGVDPRDDNALAITTDGRKLALFEKVRNGVVRVLIGSTSKMGTGTNVQKRLVAMHHLDAPWKPAEVEQRDGRILRQGNQNKEVAIYRYVTEQSFDAYMWQALETKARFIAQVMTGEGVARRAEDVGEQEPSSAEVKAIASGNPAVLTLAEADAELQRLSILKKNHADEQFLARRSVRELPGAIASLTERLSNLTADRDTTAAHAADAVVI